MGLILELVSSDAEKPPAAARKVFGAAGGTIGRGKHSDWVLPDGQVSARHARITCEGSVQVLTTLAEALDEIHQLIQPLLIKNNEAAEQAPTKA